MCACACIHCYIFALLAITPHNSTCLGFSHEKKSEIHSLVDSRPIVRRFNRANRHGLGGHAGSQNVGAILIRGKRRPGQLMCAWAKLKTTSNSNTDTIPTTTASPTPPQQPPTHHRQRQHRLRYLYHHQHHNGYHQ